MIIEEMALELFGHDSVNKGKQINPKDINHYDTFDRGKNDLVHIFQINSQHINYYYDANIITRNNKIFSYFCECPQFKKLNTCKHLAGCLIHCHDIIFKNLLSDYDISNNILDIFYKQNKNNFKEKKLMKLDIELDFLNNNATFKLFIGVDKLYAINNANKFELFVLSYINKEEFRFGVGFTFLPNEHFLSSEDEELLLFLYNYNENNNYNIFELNQRELVSILDKLRSRVFRIKNFGTVNGVKYELPSSLLLCKENDLYKLKIKDFDNYNILDSSFKYVLYNNYLYVIPNKYRKIFVTSFDYYIKEIVFKEDKLNIFKDGLLQNIKNNVFIDENINNIVITGEPIANLYFDFNNIITCDIKFDYGTESVNFFDINSNVVRDREFETNVVNSLTSYNFVKENNVFILKDIDYIGDFLNNGLRKLINMYNVFTSKKMNNISMLNKSVVKSNFSIGIDGIMSYDFNVDNINLDELGSVLTALKKNKKYYKLNNGNIINFNENQDIRELYNIFDDLNLSNNNVKNGTISIPKYRALYIDSLKRNKYKSISTDVSFNNFIDNFRKYKNLNITFDSFDSNTLRDYQKDGVRWLYTLYKCDLGGILADEMGLGKSLQVISFIKHLLVEKPCAKVLIVCPTSLVYNWKKEFDKFGNHLKYVTVAENKQKRLNIINNINDYNIFITSYGLIRNDNDEYEKINFEVCIIDEAQAIKNYQSGMTREIKKIKAHTKIALTGTPLENSILELWSIFDFIMPGYLNNIFKFKQTYNIKDVDDESLGKLEDLNNSIHPFILRRKKSEVSKELPDKIENNIYLELPAVQKSLYLSILKESESEFYDLIKSEGFNKSRFKVLQLLMKLRQVCVDPNIIFSNYDGEVIKIDKLLDIVKNYVKDNHKILIFSSFKTVIERIKSIFDNNNISNYVITGDVKSKTRMELVDKFNNDDTNCFLITLKSGGTGLNLTSADIVIHLDIWWNPQVENQATDRAHRIGQKKKVTIIKLITKGTIEEKIIDLQNKKKILSDNLIEGKNDSMVLSNLTENEFQSLLSYNENE